MASDTFADRRRIRHPLFAGMEVVDWDEAKVAHATVDEQWDGHVRPDYNPYQLGRIPCRLS